MARYGAAFFDSGVRFDSPDAHPTHMRNLSRFLENPFDDRGISLAELLSFSSDNLQRMIANDPGGELTTRITATTSALNLVQELWSDDQTQLGIRMARKMAKEAYLAALPAKVAKVMAGVVAHYGDDAPEVVECCPHGRSIFSKAPDDQMAGHIETLIDGVTAHQTDLGAPLVAQATAILTGWTAVYNASEVATGTKSATMEEKNAARANLQLMLFLNLLKLAEMFPRQPAKLSLYMQQSLLEDHPAQQDPPPTPTP